MTDLAKQPQDPQGATGIDAAVRPSASISESLNAGHPLHNMDNVGVPDGAVAEQNEGDSSWPDAAC